MKRSILFILMILTACIAAACGSEDSPQSVDLPVETMEVVGDIEFLQWSPDGSLLAGASQADRVSVWEAETGEVIFTYEFDKWMRGICWTFDGAQLVIGIEIPELLVWDSRTNELLRVAPPNPDAWARPNVFTALACSPTRPWVATGQVGGDFIVWDSTDWEKAPRLLAEEKWMVNGMVWTSSGDTVGELVNEITFPWLYLWRLPDEAAFLDMKMIADLMAFSPDDRTLLGGTSVGSVHQWDMETGEMTVISGGSSFNNHFGGYIVGIGWDPTGEVFASASNNGRIILWDHPTLHRLYYLRTPRKIGVMDWSPVENVLAMGGLHEIMFMDISELVP